MTMRVAHLLDSLQLGGTETQAVALARGLAARGIENRMIHFQLGPLRDQLDVPNVVVDRLDFDGYLKPSFPRLVRRLVRDFRAWRPDVVQTYGFYTNLPGMLAGRLARVPVLVAGKRGLGMNLTPAQHRLDRLGRLLAHATVVNARSLRTRVTAGESYGRVEVIPNCVVERGPVSPSHDPIVGMVANFRYPKDHATFIKAALLVAEKVPTAEFHLIGKGPEEPALRELVAALELGDRVRFLGALSPEQVWAATNRFAVSVLSSLSEGMPNAVLEAMLAARPVVATAIGGITEIIEDGETGFLVPPRDANALAAAIGMLLKDPDGAARIGAAARAHVVATYSVERMVNDFMNVWASIGARHS